MKALKILGKFLLTVVVLLVIAMLVIPYFYKDKMTKIAKAEINKQLKSKVDFEHVDLSLFRNFPDFSLGINHLSVVNLPDDTLLKVNRLYITIGLFSVFKDEVIEIKSILIDRPDLFLKVNDRGKVNWDIMKETAGNQEPAEEEGDNVSLMLKKVKIISGEVTYRDDENNMTASVQDLNGLLRGKFFESRTNLSLKLNSKTVSLTYGGIRYLDHTVVKLNANVDANLEDEIYNLKNNSLFLNGLRLSFEGSVAYVNDNLSLMLVYKAPDNSFKQLLSLVPSIYQDDFEKLKAIGKFDMDGYVKGVYSDTKLPDFKLHTQVSGAEITYEGMPATLKNIAFNLLVDNKGNDLNNMVINLDRFTGSLGNDKINLHLYLTNLFSDPYIDTKMSATLHLDNLMQVFPQRYLQSLTGEIITDLTLKGNVSAAEHDDLDKMLAMGSLICKNIQFDYKTNYPVRINHAQFNFSPAQIDIIGFNSIINQNRILANGKMENYLNYFLNEGLFAGHLNINSDKLDLNKLLEPWASAEATGNETSGINTGEVTYIPENIDIIASLKADTVIYRKLVFANFNSGVHVHEGRVDFEELNSKFLDGLIHLQGYYEATPEVKPHINFDLSLKNMSIGKAYENLLVIREFAPIAEKAEGIFNSTLSMSTDLDNKMNPVWTSMLGNGKLTSDKIDLNTQDILGKISDVLKVNIFKNPSTGPVDLTFKLLDGKLYNSPFNVKINDIDVEVGGWTSFDQKIDYTLGFTIPVKLLGDASAGVINHYAAEASKLGINLGDVQTLKPVVEVTGEFKDPKVRLVSLGKSSGGDAKEVVKDKVKDIVDEYAKKVNEEADKILSDARRQADSIVKIAQEKAGQVMQTARQTVNQIKTDARKQADQLVKEAAKQGPVAEIAAKKAAQELLKKADDQTDKVLQKAQQKSDQIVEDARKQSERTLQQAREKADKIRK